MTLLTPKSLKLLNLQGCLVTIGAMGCQKKIAASVLHKGADYLLSVKDNQPKLVKAFEQAFPVSELVHFEGDAGTHDPLLHQFSRAECKKARRSGLAARVYRE
jgi:predicted transposase YbfD/YdcC